MTAHPIAKTTVVTGAGGFIGSYLVKSLLRRGVAAKNIVAVDEPAALRDRKCSKDFQSLGLHLLSPTDFLDSFASLRPSLVLHMGACSNTEETRADFIRQTNFIYSQKLWELCTEQHVPYLYASSAGTYGDGAQGFSDDPAKISHFKPLSLYAQSKQDFDLWVQGAKTHPPIWSGFKFFNVYGPGEEHKGRQASMAYHLRKQLLSSGILKLYKSYRLDFADGGQLRDFVSVEDVAKVLLSFAQGKMKSGIYNLGTGQARSFYDLAQTVAKFYSKEAKIEFIEMPESLRPQYQYYTQAELKNLRAAGYHEEFLSLEDGVRHYFTEESFEG